jgi:tRNA G37 N-methylase Trm5
MFSWGNITEKLRIAFFDCSNETVVDLFAGVNVKQIKNCKYICSNTTIFLIKNKKIQNKCCVI